MMIKIKKLRNKNNESQSYLASIIGVSVRTIQNYESGSVVIPSDKLNLIAQHYAVSSEYMLDNSSENKVSEEEKDYRRNIDYENIKPPLNIQAALDAIIFHEDKLLENPYYRNWKKNIIMETENRMFKMFRDKENSKKKK